MEPTEAEMMLRRVETGAPTSVREDASGPDLEDP